MSQSSLTPCKSGAAKGIDTKFVIYPLTGKELVLLGANSGQLVGFSSSNIAYDPMDKRIAGSLPGDMSYDDTAWSLYVLPQDASQEELRVLAKDQLQTSGIRIYYDRVGTEFTHFQALDLASDPCGVFGISGWSEQSFDRSGLKQVQFTLTTNGEIGYYDRHTDSLEWDMADNVITATDGDFVNQDFRIGMSVIYETGNQAKPYGYGLVTAVTATTLTLSNTTLTVATGEGKIHGSRIHAE